MRVCCLSCVVVLFEGFVSWQRVSVACFPPNNTLKDNFPNASGVSRTQERVSNIQDENGGHAGVHHVRTLAISSIVIALSVLGTQR